MQTDEVQQHNYNIAYNYDWNVASKKMLFLRDNFAYKTRF